MNLKNTILSVAAFLLLFTSSCCNNESNNQPQADMTPSETPVIDAIMARRSIRQYKDTPVPREMLRKIAECGINAPNAMNHQEWEVRIIDSQDYLNEVTELMKAEMPHFVNSDDPKFRNAFRNAMAVFAIACPDDEYGMTMINVGLLGENICLAAQDLGLGTCILGAPMIFMADSEKARPYLDKLGFSEGYKLRYFIAVGFPDEAPDAKPRDAAKIKFIE